MGGAKVLYRDAVAVGCIDPSRGRDGDQGMAEVHKDVNAAPLCQPVVV